MINYRLTRSRFGSIAHIDEFRLYDWDSAIAWMRDWIAQGMRESDYTYACHIETIIIVRM